MIVIDDLLLRPFALLLDALHAMAVDEAYSVDDIRDSIKGNQLLFEIGERTEAEYLEQKAELEAELALAREARDQLRGKSIQVVQR